MTVAEAMHMRVPCIITYAGQTERLFTHLEDSFLLPPGDERTLAEAIVYLLSRKEQRDRFGRGTLDLMKRYGKDADMKACRREKIALSTEGLLDFAESVKQSSLLAGRMNILIVSRPIEPPWDEGGKNTAWQIAANARQHRFLLLTTRSEKPPLAGERVGWEYVYTDADFTSCQRLRLLWYLLRGRHNADVYHFVFVPTLATSRILSRVTRIHHKASVQTVMSIYTSDLDPAKARELFFADRVVAVSDWTEDKLQSLGVKNIARINVGVDLDRFKPASDRDALRKKFGLPSDVPVALFSGELSRLGSTEILLSVIQRILTENPALHFVFACPIRLPEDMLARNQAQQTIHRLSLDAAVHFVGQVDDFSELLNACDMLLFPVSRMAAKIDTPLTVLEAMAVGLPVIITDLSPLSEVFKADVGIATPLGDNEAFAEAILELAADENRRRQMGQAGQSVVREHYDVQMMVQAYEELYDELV